MNGGNGNTIIARIIIINIGPARVLRLLISVKADNVAALFIVCVIKTYNKSAQNKNYA
jgi:hypothetical protein